MLLSLTRTLTPTPILTLTLALTLTLTLTLTLALAPAVTLTRCTGRGEFIEPLPPLPATEVYLVKPDDGLSTPAVFKALGLKPDEQLPGPDPQELPRH